VDNKIAHLQMIQAVITRMAGNSFMLKGWTVTLVSALTALSARDANKLFFLIAFPPLFAFWLLDGYFLGLERSYRVLYERVRAQEEAAIDFNLRAAPPGLGQVLRVMVSFSLFAFYFVLGAATLAAVLLAHTYVVPAECKPG
jgi:hypothetical protein